MGMFDYVEFSTKCKKCGETVTGFQTKDSRCRLDYLKVSDSHLEHFYSSCDSCGEWIDVYKEGGLLKIKTADDVFYASHGIDPIKVMEEAIGERVVCTYYTLSDIEEQSKTYDIDVSGLNDKQKDLFMDDLNRAEEYLDEYNFRDLVESSYNKVKDI